MNDYPVLRKWLVGILISALLLLLAFYIRDWNIQVRVSSLSTEEARFTRQRIVEWVEDAESKGQSTRKLTALTNFHWSRVCFYPPYVGPTEDQIQGAGVPDWGHVDEEHWYLAYFERGSWIMLVRVYVGYQPYGGPEQMSCGGRSAELLLDAIGHFEMTGMETR